MEEKKIMSRVPFAWEEAHRLVGIDAVNQPMPVRPKFIIQWVGFLLTHMGKCVAVQKI